MLYIEPQSADAAFHFSVEEYFMTRAHADEAIFMTWRTGKCVMLGCNQIAHAEIDIRLADKSGIQIVRRSSGGGTIFTDPGVLLYTVILPLPYRGTNDVKRLESDYASGPVVSALRGMGIEARAEGRNDITLNGAKISGLAQYVKGNRLCTHGSLLFSANLDELAAMLKPDDGKIRSKALRSVRARVANISPLLPGVEDIEDFRRLLKINILEEQTDDEYVLTADDIARIEEIRRLKYANPDWTFGHAPKFSFHQTKRFAAGKVEIFLDIAEGVVKSCVIRGDFLGVTPIRGIEELLESQPYRRDAINRVLENADMSRYLGGVTKEQFMECVFPDER
ncbi:MAG: lipoate--protein ligase [Synergistaceae bacterium]|jgi:lipoate-protein ligase A|nr:lipoate--protein ligase [Synergistaceae bacterium]